MKEEFIPLAEFGPDRAAAFSWARGGPAAVVIDALVQSQPRRAPGAVARFVGGCVRDSLLGTPPKDIDVATVLTPAQVTAALAHARLRAAPTGIDHGTVTAVAEGVPVEITTLRADVSTDGRRATVAFTEDWSVDARRRDFTVNALYLTPALTVFDPVGGLDDLQKNRVRFIGDAGQRIREDYLRILRFFRFSARFASAFDEAGLAACTRLQDGLRSLSAERVGSELSLILALPNAPRAVQVMAECGVLATVFQDAAFKHGADVSAFARLKEYDPSAEAELGFAVLFGAPDELNEADGGKTIETALRLSNRAGKRRRMAVRNARRISQLIDNHSTDGHAARRALYRIGVDGWRDAVAAAFALKAGAAEAAFRALETLPSRWTPPAFPITGADVMARGVAQGPAVADMLKAVEEQWIAEDFPEGARAEEILEQRLKAREG